MRRLQLTVETFLIILVPVAGLVAVLEIFNLPLSGVPVVAAALAAWVVLAAVLGVFLSRMISVMSSDESRSTPHTRQD